MEELRDDIKMYLDLDRATPTHVEYWEVLSFLTLLLLLSRDVPCCRQLEIYLFTDFLSCYHSRI